MTRLLRAAVSVAVLGLAGCGAPYTESTSEVTHLQNLDVVVRQSWLGRLPRANIELRPKIGCRFEGITGAIRFDSMNAIFDTSVATQWVAVPAETVGTLGSVSTSFSIPSDHYSWRVSPESAATVVCDGTTVTRLADIASGSSEYFDTNPEFTRGFLVVWLFGAAGTAIALGTLSYFRRRTTRLAAPPHVFTAHAFRRRIGARIERFNASMPLVKLTADEHWCRLEIPIYGEYWIERAQVTSVRSKRFVISSGLVFDAIDDRYRTVRLWAGAGVSAQLYSLGWPP
jgi:hypothetical protein